MSIPRKVVTLLALPHTGMSETSRGVALPPAAFSAASSEIWRGVMGCTGQWCLYQKVVCVQAGKCCLRGPILAVTDENKIKNSCARCYRYCRS